MAKRKAPDGLLPVETGQVEEGEHQADDLTDEVKEVAESAGETRELGTVVRTERRKDGSIAYFGTPEGA